MNRNDRSKFLLYMEPKKEEKSAQPIDDQLTKLLSMAIRKAKKGTSNYSNLNEDALFHVSAGFRGSHKTDCGESSDNHDYQLQNEMVVNSLAPFYARWYRNSISKNDWQKLVDLGAFYGQDINPPY